MKLKQYLQREESKLTANYLIQCREKETNDNILKRIHINERNIEILENRLDRKRTETIKRAYEEKSAATITKDFMRGIRMTLKEKKKNLDPFHDVEILRRYSMLTEKNVAKCVKMSFDTLNHLNANNSTQSVIHESMLFLLRLVITVRMYACESTSC